MLQFTGIAKSTNNAHSIYSHVTHINNDRHLISFSFEKDYNYLRDLSDQPYVCNYDYDKGSSGDNMIT